MKIFYKIVFIFTAAFCVSTAALAKKVNYNDTSDVVNHPKTRISSDELGQKPEIKEECDPDGFICLKFYIYDGRIDIEAENVSETLRTLTIDYFLNNMVEDKNSSGRNIILKSKQKKLIERLEVDNPDYSYGYNYNYTSVFGVVDAVHDDSYEYDLPFDAGNKWILLQGIGGSFSHSNEENYYAYDFKMPSGTAILAAREGVVAKVVDSYINGGVDTSLKNKANYIYVQHSDGTIGVYAHIKYGGSMVAPGDNIQKGQKIALSGNTGYTTNPHLHFSVFKVVRGGKYKSVPIKVKTSEGVLLKLKSGNFVEK